MLVCNHMEAYVHCPDTMAFALSKFVSVPSVSGNPAHREDCRQAAIWLRKCLGQLGARTSLVSLNEILSESL